MTTTTLTTGELVGQSMMLRFEGPAFTEEAGAAFREMRPGDITSFLLSVCSRWSATSTLVVTAMPR